MNNVHEGNGEKGEILRGKESEGEPEVIRELLDAALTGDRRRLKRLLERRPLLRREFEGLIRAYPKVQMALRQNPECFGPEYQMIRKELEEVLAPTATVEDDQRIGEITRLTRDWPKRQVVEFYQAFARSVVLMIGDATGHSLSPQQALLDAAYLCSHDMIDRLRAAAKLGKHVRDGLIEVLAERWKDPDFVKQLTRERLGELVKDNRLLEQHLIALEAFLEAAA